MNWLDIVMIVVVVGLGITGLRQGMIRTVFGIAGLIGGIFLAGRYYDELAERLFPSGAIWGNIAAYAIMAIVLHFSDYYPGMEATISQSAIASFLVTAFPLRY